MSAKWKKRIRITGWILIIIYMILLVYALLFFEEYGRTPDVEFHWNFVPFQEIRRFWTYRDQVGWTAAALNLAGNIIGFIPFGFLIPLLEARLRKWGRIILNGFCLSLIIETLQLLLHTGIFDVDDLILNTLGTAVGGACFLFCDHLRKRRAA